MNEYTTSLQGQDILIKFEGLRTEAYYCPANVLTIGVGHTGDDVYEGQVITIQEARELLAKDLAWAEEAVKRNVEVPLNQNQFDALVSFVFNLGEPNFKSSTLLKKINDRASEREIEIEFERWIYANKKVLTGLVKRRAAEYKLYSSIC